MLIESSSPPESTLPGKFHFFSTGFGSVNSLITISTFLPNIGFASSPV